MSTTADQILSDADLKNIYVKMLQYLGQSDMSETRLVKRVCGLKKLYPNAKRYERYTLENCTRVVQLLKSEGYIDDERYARRLFDSLSGKLDGPRVIRVKMLRRGVPSDIVDRIVAETEDQPSDLSRIIDRSRERYEILRNKYSNDPRKKLKIRQSLYSWLMLRGFSQDSIRSILDEIDKK